MQYDLRQGDCLKLLTTISDQSIDMILTDLPYGTTCNPWDSVLPLDQLWAQYRRVAKEHAAILLFAQTPFDKVLGASNLSMLRYEWIWSKTLATGHLNANRCPLKAHENILVFYRKQPTYHPQMTTGKRHHRGGKNRGSSNYGHFKDLDPLFTDQYYPKSILEITNADHSARLHPTQKPLELCRYLIQTYTNVGDIVLDSCMGSGTTCVAAKQLGRHSIGFELDPTYFQRAVDRLATTKEPTYGNQEETTCSGRTLSRSSNASHDPDYAQYPLTAIGPDPAQWITSPSISDRP